jgi:hypothetical protein
MRDRRRSGALLLPVTRPPAGQALLRHVNDGGHYTDPWRVLLGWVRAQTLARGLIVPADVELFTITDDPEEAADRATAPLPGAPA